MKPHLISFKICPFVQRSVIMLREKGVDFDITFINPMEPPDWFKGLTPLDKVPVLKVGEQVVFESAVIVEYLDESYPPSLHPDDPLKRAQNRAWIEFASTAIGTLNDMINAKEQEGFDKARDEMKARLSKLEQQVAGPYFNGEAFAPVDMAFAPLFMRLGYIDSWYPLDLLEGLPTVSDWADKMLARESVKGSVVDDLPQLYRKRVTSSEGYLAGQIGS